MAGDKPAVDRVESSEHEAVLTGVMALANLYSNCVEAFGLIHAGQKWEKEEQLLLCRLGLQQARLLTWGDVVGVSSPPATVTDRAVPRHPSAAYPDLTEPTFFGPRDARLDETETRQKVESALSDIVDRSAHTSREEMMAKYGLKPPKKFSNDYAATLDTNRLEGFRERYELLKEVAETYARISSRRNSSLTTTTWNIADHHKFDAFIKLTQEKVQFLITLMDCKEQVDRAIRMDIKALGWHLSVDRARMALDISKLRLITEACQEEYPEYLSATQQALDNIDRERRENTVGYNPYASALATPVNTPHPVPNARNTRRGSVPLAHTAHANGATTSTDPSAGKEKRPSVLGGLFKSFGRKSHHDFNAGRSKSVSAAVPTSPTSPTHDDPPRSLSHPGPVGPPAPLSAGITEPAKEPETPTSPETPVAGLGQPEVADDDEELAPEKLRSKSVGDILEAPTQSEHEEIMKQKLERLNTNATVEEPLDGADPLASAISRHDQYHGLARQGTKQNW